MTDTDTAHYLLADRGQYLPGGTITVNSDADGPTRIVADPRLLHPSEIIPDVTLADLILGPAPSWPVRAAEPESGYVLVRLAALGPVESLGSYRECRAGWRVEGDEPPDALLGPQAAEIRAAITKAEPALADLRDPAACDAYDDAVRAVPGGVYVKAEAAARQALYQAGADDWWVAEGFSCAYGPEIVALAARDLIGKTAEWTQAAYDLLTRPWQAAFGEPIHPDDHH